MKINRIAVIGLCTTEFTGPLKISRTIELCKISIATTRRNKIENPCTGVEIGSAIKQACYKNVIRWVERHIIRLVELVAAHASGEHKIAVAAAKFKYEN